MLRHYLLLVYRNLEKALRLRLETIINLTAQKPTARMK